MTLIQKAFYAWLLVMALATAALAMYGQYLAEQQLEIVRTILTK